MEFDFAGVKNKLLLSIAAVSIIIGTVAVWGLNLSPKSNLIVSETTETNKKADEIGGKSNEKQNFTTNKQSEENKEGQNVIYVHVVGAVLKPSLYKMKEGQRVFDVIQLAKPSKQADLEQVNLAEKLVDGSQIVIPLKGANGQFVTNSSQGSSGRGIPSPGKSKSAPGKININYAGVAELEQLNGVGPALAQKIMDFRKAHGRFKTIEELNNVPGIGDKKLQSIRPNITL